MPLHRSPSHADALAAEIHKIEASGASVLQVLSWANEFLILATPGSPRPAGVVVAKTPAARRETRGPKSRETR